MKNDQNFGLKVKKIQILFLCSEFKIRNLSIWLLCQLFGFFYGQSCCVWFSGQNFSVFKLKNDQNFGLKVKKVQFLFLCSEFKIRNL